MSKINSETEVKILRFVILLLLIVAFDSDTLAVWRSPEFNPPAGSPPPPLNVGFGFQHKEGSLSLNSVEVGEIGLFDRMAVGAGSNLPTISKVEIAGGTDKSGLKFTNLTNSVETTITTDRVLTVDGDGTVILARVRCSP